jgi:hypothetical protein
VPGEVAVVLAADITGITKDVGELAQVVPARFLAHFLPPGLIALDDGGVQAWVADGHVLQGNQRVKLAGGQSGGRS